MQANPIGRIPKDAKRGIERGRVYRELALLFEYGITAFEAVERVLPRFPRPAATTEGDHRLDLLARLKKGDPDVLHHAAPDLSNQETAVVLLSRLALEAATIPKMQVPAPGSQAHDDLLVGLHRLHRVQAHGAAECLLCPPGGTHSCTGCPQCLAKPTWRGLEDIILVLGFMERITAPGGYARRRAAAVAEFKRTYQREPTRLPEAVIWRVADLHEQKRQQQLRDAGHDDDGPIENARRRTYKKVRHTEPALHEQYGSLAKYSATAVPEKLRMTEAEQGLWVARCIYDARQHGLVPKPPARPKGYTPGRIAGSLGSPTWHAVGVITVDSPPPVGGD